MGVPERTERDVDEQLVPIGRFAEATRLSVKALRHYDDIGLLAPAVVDPDTGYRYYRLGQANRAEAIRILRAVDMPLDGIAEVLAVIDDPAQVRKTLNIHRQRLADELERHRRMLAFLERLLTEQENLMPYRIALETVEPRTLASTRFHASLDELPSLIGPSFGRVAAAIQSRGAAFAGPPMLVFHDVIDEDTSGDVEVAVPCDGQHEPVDGVTFSVLAGGDVAATIHRGPYSEISPAYHALTNWMAEHGHAPAGPPREIYLNDPDEVAEAELRTRVEWPVR